MIYSYFISQNFEGDVEPKTTNKQTNTQYISQKLFNLQVMGVF